MRTHGIGSRLSLIPFAAVLTAGLVITAPRASAVSTIHVNCSRQDLQAKIDLAHRLSPLQRAAEIVMLAFELL